jgi:hypothetical protein
VAHRSLWRVTMLAAFHDVLHLAQHHPPILLPFTAADPQPPRAPRYNIFGFSMSDSEKTRPKRSLQDG